MSLATRCTHCGTVFRVVQDQLKVSEGWVRCGRCQEIFNAVEGLFDLDREPPPTWPQPAHAGDIAPAAASTAAARDDSDVDERPLLHTDDSVLPDDFADARFPSELGRDDDDVVDAPAGHAAIDDVDDEDDAHPAAAPHEAHPPPSASPPVDAPSPHFMRVAEQAQRWEQPRTRASLGLLALVLGALLAGQAAVHLRADVAARWPVARPALEAWCTIARCTVEAPLDLQALAVDSSGLIKLETEGLYRLEIVLRNRAEHDVRAPSIDLSLTDPSGRLVTRKMMSPAEFNAPRRAIAAGGELPLHALLSSGSARIAGYTIDLFYP